MDNHNEKKTKQIKRILAIITIVFVILIGYFIGRPLVHFVSDPKQFRVWVNDKGIWGVLGFIGMNILQVLLAVIPGVGPPLPPPPPPLISDFTLKLVPDTLSG